MGVAPFAIAGSDAKIAMERTNGANCAGAKSVKVGNVLQPNVLAGTEPIEK